jgi:hypothetical protein
MCAHTTMDPHRCILTHTTIYVCSYYYVSSSFYPHSYYYICVLILLCILIVRIHGLRARLLSYCYISSGRMPQYISRSHTSYGRMLLIRPHATIFIAVYTTSHPLHTRPTKARLFTHTTVIPAAYYYICVSYYYRCR